MVETAIGRYMGSPVSGCARAAMAHGARRTEAVVGAVVLYRMLDAARPNAIRRSVAPA